MKKSWYDIKNKDGGTADISIHDEIGLWGVSAKDFIDGLKSLGDISRINLSIHSPGGSVFDGLAIYNSLKQHPAPIYAKVAGLAASAASFILMAADNIAMPEDSFIMIHQTQGGAYGQADDLREMADLMEKLTGQIANIYAKRTGQPLADIEQMMANETWMNADEAVALGFADTVTGEIGMAAKAAGFERYFKSLPVNLEKSAPSVESLKDLERILRDAGQTRTQATATVANLKAIVRREAEAEGHQQPDYSPLQARLTGLQTLITKL
jgi:ATP-dependent Clp protease, protease subunit